MSEEYYETLTVLKFFDSLFAIDGLGPLDEYYFYHFPLDIPLNNNIDWGKYIYTEYAGCRLENEYGLMWLHLYSANKVDDSRTHNKNTCAECNDHYAKFIKALTMDIEDRFIEYSEFIAKWMIFNDYKNDELMAILMEYFSNNENDQDIMCIGYFIVYWGDNQETMPNLHKILNKYCLRIKELICKNGLVSTYINFMINMKDNGAKPTQQLWQNSLNNFYHDVPIEYQLGVMI